MKTNVFSIAGITIFTLLIFIGCNSAKYEGTYTGTMPCTDCEGIETEITINKGRYVIKRTYLETDNTEQNTFTQCGTYKWNEERSVLIFDNDPEQQYLVRENTLVALNQNGKEVTGDLADLYVLKRKR